MSKISQNLAIALCMAASLVGCAQDDVSRDEWEVAQEPEDRLARVDNGDGTWSYELPEGFDPEQRVVGRRLTWQYVGQARFSHQPEHGGAREFVAAEPAELDALGRLQRLRRIDAQGRMWQVESRNDDAPARDEQPASEAAASAPPTHPPGTRVTWHPSAWDHFDCAPGGAPFAGNELHVWDGDGREAQSGLVGRQKTAVQVLAPNSACSGVIVDNDKILTAAHCVSDDNNNPVSVVGVSVCRAEPVDCKNASSITLASGYGGGSGTGGGTDFADDWAVIDLSGSYPEGETPQADHMHLSTAGDGTLAALTNVFNLAFPAWAEECDPPNPAMVYLNREMEPIAGVGNRDLRLRLDGSPGHSGSPIYYCPDGDNNACGSGDMGHVIGVFAGWDSVANRHVAAKVSAFESEADDLIFD